ncbi:MAG: DNA-binding transcriptional LysR family regulator [Bacteroidia bacterium]|jgi:DNA-binding transcriptional LysR family regulator
MDYTFQQLRIFSTVSETQSITKAAELLHISQPAVSVQLKKFQDFFDNPLYEVIGRKLHLTDFGHEIAAVCRSTMQEAQQLKNKSKEHKGELWGTLKISVVSTAKYVMPYLLSDFLRIHPGVDLKMDVTNKLAVVESLEKNEIDFAMVSTLPEHLQVEKIELMPNKLHLIGSKNMPMITELNNELGSSHTFIFREKGSATRQIMENVLKDKKVSIAKQLQLTSNEAVKQAVLAGLGYSIMPLIGFKNALQSGDVKIMPVDGLPVTTNWHLIWLKNKKFGAAQTAFITYLKEEKDAILHDKFQWFEQF